MKNTKGFFEGVTVGAPTYIHNSLYNFKESLFANNIVANSGEQKVLDITSIKQRILGEVWNEIAFFESIEQEIVDQTVKKFGNDENIPFKNRAELLNYLNTYRDFLASEDKTESFALLTMKKKIIDSGKILDKVKGSIKYVSQQFGKEKKGSKDPVSRDLQSIANEILKDEKNYERAVDKMITKVVKVYEKDLDSYLENLQELVSTIITTATAITEDNSGDLDKRTGTNAEKFLKLMNEWKIGDLINQAEAESLIKDVVSSTEENLKKHSRFELIAKLGSQSAANFVNLQIKDSQLQTILGDLFEYAVFRDCTNQILGTSSEKSKTFFLNFLRAFPEENIKMVGNIQSLSSKYVMDIQLAKTNTEKETLKNIAVGLSLKLKVENKLDLAGKQPMDEYWKLFETWLEKKDLEDFQYLRKNLLFFKGEQELADFSDQFDLLEKELFSLLFIIRMTAGLFERAGERRKMWGSDDKTLYYTGFLFGAEKVYSFADLLKTLISSSFIIKQEKDWKKKEMIVSKNKKDELFFAKRKRWKDLAGKTSYTAIKEDSEVKRILEEISNIFGEQSYQDMSEFSYTLK